MVLHEPEARERMRRIRVLLASRYDYLPQVRVAKSDAVDGPAESRYVPCECQRASKLRCNACNDTGLRKARKGDAAWDEYVEAPLEEARVPRLFAGGFNPTADIARIDRELRKLRVDELARKGIVADEETWKVRLDTQEKQGSYAELRRALDRLERVCPRLRWAIRIVYESNLNIDAPRAVTLEPLAVAYLALIMRGPVKIPARYEEEAAADKRRSIEELLALGWKTSRVAKSLGVPVAKVKAVARARRSA